MNNLDLLSKRKKNIVTAHFNTYVEDFAPTVIVCSSATRAEIISKYLTDCALVNNVRAALGYVGYYKGKRISVMTTGMGMPSTEIYIAGLIYGYKVKTIIKCDTCLGINKTYNINDIMVFESATTQKPMQELVEGKETYYADKELIELNKKITKNNNNQFKINYGKGYASVYFGLEPHELIDEDYIMKSKYRLNIDELLKQKIDAIEMENYLFYKLCSDANVKAISICRIAAATFAKSDDNFLFGTVRENVVETEVLMCLELAYASS